MNKGLYCTQENKFNRGPQHWQHIVRNQKHIFVACCLFWFCLFVKSLDLACLFQSPSLSFFTQHILHVSDNHFFETNQLAQTYTHTHNTHIQRNTRQESYVQRLLFSWKNEVLLSLLARMIVLNWFGSLKKIIQLLTDWNVTLHLRLVSATRVGFI